MDNNIQVEKKKKITKIILFIIGLLLTFIIIVFLIYGYLPWISYFGPSISIRSEINKLLIDIEPNIMLNATTFDGLKGLEKIIGAIQWNKSVAIGNISISSSLSNDGTDYGGVIVTGPGIRIEVSQIYWQQPIDDYFSLKIIDVRYICGGVPKEKSCVFHITENKSK